MRNYVGFLQIGSHLSMQIKVNVLYMIDSQPLLFLSKL